MTEPEEKRFKHRDLNWLSFNQRVLQEAADSRNPVYERLKFLAIFSSNLDEYYRVRVSQLRQIKKIDKDLRKKLALKPSKIVKQIIARVKEQQKQFGAIFSKEIIPLLASEGIHLVEHSQFTEDLKKQIHQYYQTEIASKIETQSINFDTKRAVFLENDTIYFLVSFKDSNEAGIVNIPVKGNGRFIHFSSEENKQDKNYIVFVDDVVRTEIHQIFPEHEIDGIFEIKMSRDAELYLDDEFEGVLAEKIYASLNQRQDGQPTRLLYDAEMPKPLQKKFRKYLGLGKIDMMPGGKHHNFRDFFNFPDLGKHENLHYKKLPPIPHKALEASTDYFKTIKENDRLLHFPYMSFSYVADFVEQAANDEGVSSIKISLYRVADESRLTSGLLKALENGKKVTVFIEAKARFDEENNIEWGRKFEDQGALVIYSYPKIKVHSKILLIKRHENGEKVKYAYIGTGNFNSETSKIYCDHGLFTANYKLTKELNRVFKVLKGKLIIPRCKHLLVSPFNTRNSFTQMILNEIKSAEQGERAEITAKMNSLEDKEIIDLLYRASNSGVKIRLLVRGFTCLIPGVKGMSKNIYMTSIVDRFLEHGRIYRFYNGGDEKIFFGSADWMSRNLDRRIEVLAPVEEKDVAAEMNDILELQLTDDVKARVLDKDEKNEYVSGGKGENRSQYSIYNYLKEKYSS